MRNLNRTKDIARLPKAHRDVLTRYYQQTVAAALASNASISAVKRNVGEEVVSEVNFVNTLKAIQNAKYEPKVGHHIRINGDKSNITGKVERVKGHFVYFRHVSGKMYKARKTHAMLHKESVELDEGNNPILKNEQNPPPMLVLRRTGIRIFPDGRKVALYVNKPTGLVFTIPFSGGGTPASIPPVQATHEELGISDEQINEARIKIIKARVRGGKVQRRKKVSNVKGYTIRGGRLIRLSSKEKLNRKRGARRGKVKRRAKLARSLLKRKRSLRKRKAIGL